MIIYDYKTTITKSPMLVHIIWYVTPPSTIWLTTELKQLSNMSQNGPCVLFWPHSVRPNFNDCEKDTRTFSNRKKNIEKFDSQLS